MSTLNACDPALGRGIGRWIRQIHRTSGTGPFLREHLRWIGGTPRSLTCAALQLRHVRNGALADMPDVTRMRSRGTVVLQWSDKDLGGGGYIEFQFVIASSD